MSALSDKAKRYIEQLESIRVKGDWNAFPETIRKITKHASSQTLLIQTATAEHAIAVRAAERNHTQSRPLDTLIAAIKNADNRSSEEVFQAETCLSWSSLLSEDGSFLSVTPASAVVALFDRYGRDGHNEKGDTSMWTRVCLVKSAYTQAHNHLRKDDSTQAQAVMTATSNWLELNGNLVRRVPQLAYWSEQALAQQIRSDLTGGQQLKLFQIWASIASKTPEASAATYGNGSSHIPRSYVWSNYYTALSDNLRPTAINTAMSRQQLMIDLRAAETEYEASFLRSKAFPKATESNKLVEQWVEQVIKNWQVVCGPTWHEGDLGEGGRNAATRNVLDILYRAASKTFQSTLILRRLFQVHKSLTEFDLAFHCLDTYIELTERTKARAAKSGETNPDADSDETVILTVSEGIETLCSYGRQKEAQKAYELALKMEDWLDQIMPEEDEPAAESNGHADITEPVHSRPMALLSPEALQVISRAIGVAKAHWAKWTPFSESRTELQSEALEALKKAVTFSEAELNTMYALAVLAAETRELPLAITWTKMALSQISQYNLTDSRYYYAFWHLMALLLTSQQDFETAYQSSAIALEEAFSTTSSDRTVNGSREKSSTTGSAFTDMECDDLQRVIELEITRLALVELTDGVEAALNHSNELVVLYSKLFRRFDLEKVKLITPSVPEPPKTSAGTVHSVRGSILSRRKDVTSSIAPSQSSVAVNSSEKPAQNLRPITQGSTAPTIQVTDEKGRVPKKHHHLPFHHHHHERGSRQNLVNQNTIHHEPTAQPPVRSSVITASTTTTNDQPHTVLESGQRAAYADSETHELDSVAEERYGENGALSEKVIEADQTTQSYYTSQINTLPLPQFPQVLAQKHALAILCKIWLTTATLYRRASMFEDAKEACEEATRAAGKFESIVMSADPAARALADAGWGGSGKSSDDVWADVYCARAELLLAVTARRKEEDLTTSSDDLREVVELYEQCLMYCPNHAAGIVGLSGLLLDYYEHKIDLGKRVGNGRLDGITVATEEYLHEHSEEHHHGNTTPGVEHIDTPFGETASGEDLRKTPENLNRIAARDRAYGLLSILTKLDHGWDNSEAWFALARAHELGGEVDKAKNILWYCIELEDTRPIRHWRNLGCSGYVL